MGGGGCLGAGSLWERLGSRHTLTLQATCAMGKKKTKSRVEEVEDDDDDVAEVAGELDVAADGTAARDGRPKRRAAAERVLLLCTKGVTFRCVSILVCARTHERAYERAYERA